MITRLAILAAAMALACAAQTTVPTSMLSGPAGSGGVMVITPQGQVVMAVLGTGVQLTQRDGAWVLEAVSAPAPAVRRVTGEVVVRTDATWALAHAPADALKVYRNGVRQTPAIDYTIQGLTIVPIREGLWMVDDLVTADYEW